MEDGCHRGRGRPAKGEKKGVAAKRGGEGKKRGGHLGFLWEKETTPQMTSIFASNGPQPFTSSTHQRLTFGQHFFWDITVCASAINNPACAPGCINLQGNLSLGFRYPTLVGSYKVSHTRLWNPGASFVSLALRPQISSNHFIIFEQKNK
jgi:hypothetical protein